MFRLNNSTRGRRHIDPFLQLVPTPSAGAGQTRVIGDVAADEHSGPVDCGPVMSGDVEVDA